MGAYLAVFVFSFLFYLLLTICSGGLILWSPDELVLGLVLSLITALLVKKLFNSVGVTPTVSLFNPRRWLLLLAYVIGPFFTSMVKANLDVAYRVITGDIRPGIVRIPSNLRTDLGVSMLANSITLTPGTLSVDVDEKNNIYVHWIYVRQKNPKTDDICSDFPYWIRGILE